MAPVSKRLFASYILDWIVIIAIAGAGGGLSFVTPYKRPFSLLDLSISYPYHPESITVTTVGIVGLVVPATIIAFVVLLFVPGPGTAPQNGRSRLFSIKLWELEKGLAGLALSVAMSFFLVQALKNLFGKPRPNCLGSCMPDLTSVELHTVGGYGQRIDNRWALVDAAICTNPDTAALNDGFRSFPSGHCSFAWAGLLYLSLFLCSKFSISIPHLPVDLCRLHANEQFSNEHELLPLHHDRASSSATQRTQIPNRPNFTPNHHSAVPMPKPSVRNLAASPPNYLIVPAFTPIAGAIYICATRYFDFYHFGSDIIGASLIGILTSYFAFRWYHLPLNRGQGWAWGPRSTQCAFGIGVGTGSYTSASA